MSDSLPKKILAAGAEDAVRKLLSTVPSAIPLQFVGVRDSTECLAQVATEPFDLVITYLQSSAAEDLELLRQIRRLNPGMKVIVMSDERTSDEVLGAIHEHAFSFFSLPFEAERVVGMVAHALEIPAWEDGIEVLSAQPAWIALRLRCRKLTAERVLQFMHELEMDLPALERENIGTAFREMLLNAIEHGAGFDPNKTVEVSYVRTSRVLIYQIRDPGPGFSFKTLPHAAISNPQDKPAEHILYRLEHDMRAGGFGILMVRNLVDELFYNDKGNEVLLIKYL